MPLVYNVKKDALLEFTLGFIQVRENYILCLNLMY